MKKKYLPLYYEWMNTGLPSNGLCESLENSCDLDYFDNGQGINYWGYWADKGDVRIYSGDVNHEERMNMLRQFTPLRQNIVLLLAAMNGEL